jgi:hypothetical protein
MQPSQASRWITDARFAPYLAYSGGDHAVAPELYVWNARIAAAAFETLHHVEVLPRNVVDQRFAPFDPSVSATATWLTDPTILNETSRRRVAETIERSGARASPPRKAGIGSEAAFAQYERLAAANAPGQLPQAAVSTRLRPPLGDEPLGDPGVDVPT